MVIAGGTTNPRHFDQSEAEIALRFVPKHLREHVLLETKSRTTEENFERVFKVLLSHFGAAYIPRDFRLVIITNPLHSIRARIILRRRHPEWAESATFPLHPFLGGRSRLLECILIPWYFCRMEWVLRLIVSFHRGPRPA
jgi:hypothetical protein